MLEKTSERAGACGNISNGRCKAGRGRRARPCPNPLAIRGFAQGREGKTRAKHRQGNERGDDEAKGKLQRIGEREVRAQ
eukprot:6064342-Pleurochrysis_carterae.AAC.4